MFLFAYIYNSASSYASNQVMIIPIIVSIALHHHIKISLFKKGTTIFFFQSSILSKDMKDKIYSSNLFPYSDIITKEIESWKSYADCLRKQDRKLFYEMLNSSYKYSSAITVKGKEYSLHLL